MQYRKLGKSDLQVPVVSFGAWAIGGWMWGGSDDDEAIRAIHCAIDHGVNCIDTAPIYGMGHSEEVVGKAIAGKRDEVIIATKCCLRWDKAEGEHFFDTKDNEGNSRSVYRNLRKDSIIWECEQSLRRLNVDVIDLLQCHWPDATTPLEETMEGLTQLQAEGKIRAIGVSNFTVDMIETCLKHGTVVSEQSKYNALERDLENEIIPCCVKNDIGILAYCPIAQGLLTGKITVDREFKQGDHRKNSPLYSQKNRRNVLEMLEKVQPIADAYSITLGQLFIAWLNAQPGMASALVGARNEAQVMENAAAGDIQLREDELKTIRELVEAVPPLS